MKKYFLFLFVAICVFAFIACDGSGNNVEPQYGSITVSTSIFDSKTIEPPAEKLDITTYKVKGTHTNGSSFPEETMTSNPYTKEHLLVGDWTIVINGYNKDNELVASKSQTVGVKKDETVSSTFKLEYPEDGTGSYSITFAVPTTNTSLSKISYTITPIDGSSTIAGDITEYTTADNKRKYNITKDNVAVGEYKLVAILKNSNNETLLTYGPEALGIYKGLQSTSEIFIDEKYLPMAAKPVITPDGGNFTGSANVTITCATSGATIYYTTDGTIPTDSSTEYEGQFSITENTDCIKAVAYKTGLTSSEVASSNPFHISVEAPAITPDGGSYNNPQSVTISTVEGATVYYTTDGSTPTKSSTKYTAAFNVSTNNTVVKAIATKDNMENSAVTTSQKFTFKVATPIITPDSCTTETSIQITLVTSTTDASIRYTTDGTIPTSTSGNVYSSPFTLLETGKTVKAIAYRNGMTDSDVASSSGSYTLIVEAPTFSVTDSEGGKRKIVVSGGDLDATIKYSTDDGTNWNVYDRSSTVLEYSSPITVMFKIEKTGLVSVEKSVSVTWNTGSGQLTYESPNHYLLSIKTPEGWDGNVTTISKDILSAGWNTTPTSVSYQWYVDGEVVSGKTSDSFQLKVDKELSEGSHNIVLYAISESKNYSTSLRLHVGEPNCIVFSSDSPFTVASNSSDWDGLIYFSTDAITWSEWTGNSVSSVDNELYFRGRNNTRITGYGSSVDETFSSWIIDGNAVKCTGNIETLLDYETVAAGGHPEMAKYCFSKMFVGCTSLIESPKLQAEKLSEYCYNRMFKECSNLVVAPELPATKLAAECYSDMFAGCTGLSDAPELPATKLAAGCYSGMFSNCLNLAEAPMLPAISLDVRCYLGMFNNCKNLTKAPELPATQLKESCYREMFCRCTGLIEAPTLPATELVQDCYYYMFESCSNINVVSVAFSEWHNNCSGWLSGVSLNGTFVCPAALDTSTRGSSRVPEGWTVINP